MIKEQDRPRMRRAQPMGEQASQDERRPKRGPPSTMWGWRTQRQVKLKINNNVEIQVMEVSMMMPKIVIMVVWRKCAENSGQSRTQVKLRESSHRQQSRKTRKIRMMSRMMILRVNEINPRSRLRRERQILKMRRGQRPKPRRTKDQQHSFWIPRGSWRRRDQTW